MDLRKFTADEFSHIHEVLNGICKFLVAPGGPAPAPAPVPVPTAPTAPGTSLAGTVRYSAWAIWRYLVNLYSVDDLLVLLKLFGGG